MGTTIQDRDKRERSNVCHTNSNSKFQNRKLN